MFITKTDHIDESPLSQSSRHLQAAVDYCLRPWFALCDHSCTV